MNIFLTVLVAVQMLAALAMIGLILVQHGKGADMGAAFGSGSAGSLFGASGSANFLSRTTAVLAFVFFSCTLALAYVGHGRVGGGGGSLLERATSAPAAPAPAATPAAPANSGSASEIPTSGTGAGAAPQGNAAPAVPAAPATPATSETPAK